MVCDHERSGDWTIIAWAGPPQDDGRAGFLVKVKPMAVLDPAGGVDQRRTQAAGQRVDLPRTPEQFIDRRRPTCRSDAGA